MTLRDFLHSIYVPLRLRGRSHNSVRLLEHAIRQYGKFLRRDATLEDFDDLTVSQFLAHRGAKLSPYSVERERSGLLALWRLAADRRLVDTRPCVQAELLPERTPRAFTVAELERLYAAAEDTPGWIGPVAAGAFWPAVLMALYESGERIEAMLHVPKSCYTAPFLRVPASVRKGKRTERIYEFSADTCRLVEIAARHDAATLFLWPMDPSGIYNHFHKITGRAGLGTGRDVMFHCLRRTTASHLAAATGSVDAATKYLGHSSDRVTRRSYIDPRIVGAGGVKPIDALPRIRPPAAPRIHRLA
jgi:site-specific recombinase XerD